MILVFVNDVELENWENSFIISPKWKTFEAKPKLNGHINVSNWKKNIELVCYDTNWFYQLSCLIDATTVFFFAIIFDFLFLFPSVSWNHIDHFFFLS